MKPLAFRAPLTLVLAGARRRPGRFALAAFGIALAAAFAGSVLAEATTAGDRGARAVLSSLSPLQRTVRVTWQGDVTPSVRAQARRLLAGRGLAGQTEVVLLNGVRLGGTVVRPAAIEPLAPWLAQPRTAADAAQAAVASCVPRSCPTLSTAPIGGSPVLAAAGVRIPILGQAMLRSAAPLGYLPAAGRRQTPVLLTATPAGLNGSAASAGSIARTAGWRRCR